MSAHTSGPWEQNADTVWRGGHAIVCHPINAPQSIADAALVAASPDLLAACERMLPWLGKLIADGENLKCAMPGDCLGALAQARAAIAKATGRVESCN